MQKIILPIYYTQVFKTRPEKVWLVGDNAFRNWHYFLKNEVKQYYHMLVGEQIDDTVVKNQYKMFIDLYLKNPASDGSNVASRMEKFTLDGLQECGVVVDDNSKYHMGTTWELKGMDKTDPRVEITLQIL